MTEQNAFYYDGYQDAKQGKRSDPPEGREYAEEYMAGYNDYLFEHNQYLRMSESQLQNYITEKKNVEDFGAEYENAVRIYKDRFVAG